MYENAPQKQQQILLHRTQTHVAETTCRRSAKLPPRSDSRQSRSSQHALPLSRTAPLHHFQAGLLAHCARGHRGAVLLSCGTVHLASHTFARSFGLLVRFTLSSLPQLSARLIAHLIARLMCTPGPALGPQHGPVLPRHSCDVMVGCNKSRFKPPLQAIHKGALLFQIPRQGWRTRGAGCLRVRAGERERVPFCTHMSVLILT